MGLAARERKTDTRGPAAGPAAAGADNACGSYFLDQGASHRMLVEEASDVIYTIDPQGTITGLNKAFEAISGWRCSEWLGQNFLGLIHKDDRDEAMAIHLQIQRGERPPRFELRLRFRSGEFAHVEFAISPMIRDGRVIGTLGVGRDVTATVRGRTVARELQARLAHLVVKRTQELAGINAALQQEVQERQRIADTLRCNERQLQAIIDGANLGILMTDAQGFVVRANPCLQTMLGYTAAELSRRTVFDLLHPAEKTKAVRHMRAARRGDYHHYTRDSRMVRQDGTVVWVRAHVSALRYDREAVVGSVGLIEDVTAAHVAREQVGQYQQQLRDMTMALALAEERERARIAAVLHDGIGHLLAAAKMKLNLLGGGAGDPDAQRAVVAISAYLDEAMQGTRSLSMELSPPMLHELGLCAALEWLCEHTQVRYGLKVVMNRHSGCRRIQAEVGMLLYRMVQELILNAAKHAQATTVQVSITCARRQVTIEVGDDGAGFDAARPPSLPGRGHGFGLLNIRERLHYLGGSLTVRSAPGRGCTVVLVAPETWHGAAVKGRRVDGHHERRQRRATRRG